MSAILSLEVFQERQCQERFRSRAHAALDRFLDRLETPMSEPGSCAPTLMEITEAVFQERCGLTAALVEAFIERRHGPFLAQEEAACRKCERLLQARPSRSRTVETLLGAVTLERPYFYCVSCHHGFYPLDEALGLSGQRKQWDVQQAGVKLGLEMPHELSLEAAGRAHRRIDERLCAPRCAAPDRVVAGAAGVSGCGRDPGSHRPGRRRAQVAAHRGVGHRCGRGAQPSAKRQRHPAGAQEEPGSAPALAGRVSRGQGVPFLPGRRRTHRAL